LLMRKMHSISTRTENLLPPRFASQHLQAPTNQLFCENKLRKSNNNFEEHYFRYYSRDAMRREKQFAYATKFDAVHINWRNIRTLHHDHRDSMLILQILFASNNMLQLHTDDDRVEIKIKSRKYRRNVVYDVIPILKYREIFAA